MKHHQRTQVHRETFWLEKAQYHRALDAAKDDVDYKTIINGMIKTQQTIHDADATIALIDKVKADLEAEVEEDS